MVVTFPVRDQRILMRRRGSVDRGTSGFGSGSGRGSSFTAVRSWVTVASANYA